MDPMEVDHGINAPAKEKVDLTLTAGSAIAIANNAYIHNREHPNPTRITMQVIDLARLKYSFAHGGWGIEDGHEPISRLSEENGPSKSCAPYRLILSDGEHCSPAKFYREQTGGHLTACGREPFEIHQLVRAGTLKKGTIIQFTPNSHTDSGAGIATIFSMEILSTESAIVGVEKSLKPSHDGVLAFSPSDRHQCTESLDDRRSDPLPLPVLQLAKAIKDECGFCTIAGGAVLDKYFYDLNGCHHCYATRYSPQVASICKLIDSQDVDLFVPQHPGKLDLFYTTGSEVSTDPTYPNFDFCNDILPGALKKLYETHGLQNGEQKHEFIRMSGIEGETGDDYGWMRIFVGLREKLDLKLFYSDGHAVDKPVQILVMDVIPDRQSRQWDELVVEGFDADIIKSVAVLSDDARVQDIQFYGSPDFPGGTSLKQLPPPDQFHYTMRPCHSFGRMMERLAKYKQRGFNLANLRFDSRVSPGTYIHR